VPIFRSRINTRGDEELGADASNALVLYKQRWVQLTILSLLALLSDMVCFSVAAAPETWEKVYDHGPSDLINIFLLTNVIALFYFYFLIIFLFEHASFYGSIDSIKNTEE
jgi:hypothetical protein